MSKNRFLGRKSIGILCLFLILFVGYYIQITAYNTSNAEQKNFTLVNDFSLLLGGDAIITQSWSYLEEPEFISMVDKIRGADAAIVNLEMLIHTFKGYAQADSIGTYMAAKPIIAKELAWTGIDMVANANNHTFDYGSTGVLETVEFVEKAGIVIAGSGKDLQAAREPKYFDTHNGRVALVSTTSTFIDYGKASRSRPDIHGRPGLNPLKVDFKKILTKTFAQVNEDDLQGNLEAVREAAKKADYVVFSIHAHRQGRWLKNLAHDVLDQGADIFFAHGPHVIKGVEIYRGKPIFYGLGNFVFQNEQIDKLPVEFYERYGLSDDATPEDALKARSESEAHDLWDKREPWEGLLGVVGFKTGVVSDITVIPIDLGFQKALPIRGRSKLANEKLGKHIIEFAAKQAKEYGVEITYDSKNNIGHVEL